MLRLDRLRAWLQEEGRGLLPHRPHRKLNQDRLWEFLGRTQGGWFRLIDFTRHFGVDRKTAWEYLQKFLHAGLLRHNRGRSAAVRYALGTRFLVVRADALEPEVEAALSGLPPGLVAQVSGWLIATGGEAFWEKEWHGRLEPPRCRQLITRLAGRGSPGRGVPGGGEPDAAARAPVAPGIAMSMTGLMVTWTKFITSPICQCKNLPLQITHPVALLSQLIVRRRDRPASRLPSANYRKLQSMFDPWRDFVLSLTNVYQGGEQGYMIRDVEHETMPREDLEALQLKRLQAVVERVYHLVPFYRRRMDELGVKPEHIRTLEDIRLLPFTAKQDLRDNYPFGMFAAPMDQIVRIHASSGTTGKPTPVAYTQRDLETWAELMARTLAAGGAHRGDIVHVAYGYGLFTGGLGVHYGAERLGAAVIPVSGGQTRRQIMLIQDFGPTVLCCTPSFALYLAEVGQEMGVDFAKTKLRVGIFGAEPWTEGMRVEIEKRLSLDALDIYGLSEILGPGVAIECLEAKAGLHMFEDHFLPEIINPATLERLAPGETGELVITTLTKEAFPLLRYRTRDITSLNYAPCICGRTIARISRFQGRSDDMLIIRGVNVFPSQIESVLMETPGVAPHYQLIVDREGQLDTLEVQVEVDEATFSDEVKQLQALAQSIQRKIKDYFTVSVKVKLVEPQSIPRSEGKAKRVIDKRQL